VRKVFLILAILGLAGGLVACTPLGSSEAEELSASGTIEADEVHVVAELGGRIVEILADEGDEVTEGQVLIHLDTAFLEAQVGEAQAALEAARAELAKVEAGPRPGEIAAAEAALLQAIAERDKAKKAWEDAKTARDDPQELNARINQARTEIELAEQEVERARAELAHAKWKRDLYEEGSLEYRSYDKLVEAAEEMLLAAQASYEGAKRQLEHLIAMRDNPLVLNAQVNAAEAQYKVAQAAVEVAKANLDALKAGPTREEIAIAKAKVNRAKASLNALRVQLEKMTIRAPISGLVTSLEASVGEMAIPGATLMTLASLDEVTLTIYIPTDEIGNVMVGQGVEVRVDSFPGEVFLGEVVYISPRAEFTPKNVQTREERVSMVFAVEVRLPNPEHKLKPGMPADAVIRR
jgi:HlyD family secretion protein